MKGPISDRVVEDSGVVVLDASGRCVFASSVMTKADAEAMCAQLGAGALVVDVEDLRWRKNLMVGG
jgi:hypothetical protein